MSVRTIAAGGRGRTVAPDSASTGDARSARAFEVARRHSRLVRILRVAFIVGGVGGVVALTGLGLYRTFGGAIGRLSIGDLSVDGTKITMDRPRLTGARPDGGGYVINAAKAIQDVTDPTEVDLVEIDGDIVPANHDTLHLTATSGHYDSSHERIDLFGVVRMKNSSYTIDLRSAHIEFKTGEYSSRDPITVVTTYGDDHNSQFRLGARQRQGNHVRGSCENDESAERLRFDRGRIDQGSAAMRSLGALAAIFVLATLNAQAAPNKPTQGSPLLPGGNSKEPISIEADKLVYFDKEQKAIYSGNVVAIQGDTRLTCSIMTVHMTKTAAAGAPAAGRASGQSRRRGPGALRQIEQRQPPGLRRSRHCPVEDPDRDGRQRRL